ncbi:MAG: hypothetical protein FWG25_01680 [Promicromonosporaceae bacterium]|nr:hypothetical protein [Promicromonosporaceae bacterium]
MLKASKCAFGSDASNFCTCALFRWPSLVHALLEIPRSIGQCIADCFEELQDAVGMHGNYQIDRVESAKGLSKELDQILKGEVE